MILKKVAWPVGVDGKSYWEAIILEITNDKFCSLRANFKQELFEKFQGKFYSIQIWKWFSDTNEILIYGREPYQELLRIFKELKSSDVWNTLWDYWKLYQTKHYARDDDQVEELMEPEEEYEASGKDDWQIEMPDGDEIDDIEEASVDDD
jgi:hypothetical protein